MAVLSGENPDLVNETLSSGVTLTLFHHKETRVREICEKIRLFVNGLKQSAELSSKRIPQPGEVDEPESKVSPDHAVAATP
jgi:hypothetical protein